MGKQYQDKIRFHIQRAAARGWSEVDGFRARLARLVHRACTDVKSGVFYDVLTDSRRRVENCLVLLNRENRRKI